MAGLVVVGFVCVVRVVVAGVVVDVVGGAGCVVGVVVWGCVVWVSSRRPGRRRSVRPRYCPGEQASPEREQDHCRGDHRRLTPESSRRRSSSRGDRSRNDARHRCVRRGDQHRGRLAAERCQQRVAVGRALRRVLPERRLRERSEVWRRIGLQFRDRRRRRVPVHVQQRKRLVGHERQRARQHPKQDHAERVDVARRPGRLGGGLLGREVRGRPQHRPGLGQRARTCNAAGQPEVAELRPAFLVEEDVRRLRDRGERARDRGVARGPPRCPWRCERSRRAAAVPAPAVPRASRRAATRAPCTARLRPRRSRRRA